MKKILTAMLFAFAVTTPVLAEPPQHFFNPPYAVCKNGEQQAMGQMGASQYSYCEKIKSEKTYECKKMEGPESWSTIKSLSGNHVPIPAIVTGERQKEIYELNGYKCE
jgi:hypothetical protein